MRTKNLLRLLLILLLGAANAGAQTTLISNTVNNGGFESGATGWTVLNGTQPNYWVFSTGATAGFSGTNAAYITNSTTTPYAHSYNLSSISAVQFYQDVTFPANETNVSLTFKWIGFGEGSFDRLRVFLSPTTVTPTPGTELTADQLGVDYNLQSNWNTVNITIPSSMVGNSAGPSTRRLIFQWRNDGSLGTQPPAAVDSVVLTSQCTPLVLPATNISPASPTTATANWATYSNATSYQIRYRRSADPLTVPTWATPTTVPGGATATSFNLTGLLPSSSYIYQILAVGGCPSWSVSQTFSTPCGVAPLPYVEDFESITTNNQMPNCMTVFNPAYSLTYATPPSGNNRINHTPGGSKFGAFYWAGSGTQQGFVTPGVSLTAGSMYEVSFWYITEGISGWTNLGAYFGTSPTPAGLINPIGTPLSNPLNTTYQKYTGRFIAPTTGVYYVGVQSTYTSTPNYLTIDDISITPLPPCSGTPSVGGPLTVSNTAPCLGSTVQFDYSTLTTNASNLAYSWWYSPTGVAGSYTQIAGATGITYTTPPIANVGYYYTKVTCTNTNLADSTPVVTITPNVPTLPYYETFESITTNNQLPNCMSALALGTGALTFTTNQTGYNRVNHTTGGSKFASLPNITTPPVSALYTPAFNLVAGKTYEFSFWYRVGNSSNGAPAPTDWTLVQASYDTAAVISMRNLIGRVRALPITNTGYRQFVETFTPTVTRSYYIGILAQRSNNGASSLTIDDIGLVELPPCSGKPNAGGAPIAQFPAPCPGGITDIVPDTAVGVTYNSNMHYQWQSRTNSGAWANVSPNGTDTLRRYTTDPINDTTYYRVIMRCGNATAPNDTNVSGQVRVIPNFPTIPYTETFESITAANTLPPCMTASDLGGGVLSYISNQTTGNRTNHTTGGSKFVSFSGNYNTTDALFTPGMFLRADSTYEFSFWYIAGNATNGAPLNFNALDVRVGTTPIYGSMSNTIASVRPAPISNTTYQQYKGTFRPATAGVYYFAIGANRSILNGNFLSIDDIGVVRLPECSGAPAGGAVTPLTATVCPGAITQLALNAAASNAGNITYQWQQRTIRGTWGPAAAGFGMTQRNYETAPINDTMVYRVILTCNSAGGTTATSDSAIVYPAFPALPYVETFESITAADQLPGCMSATNLGSGVRTYIVNQTTGNRTNHTTGGSKFASFVVGTTAATNAVYTPGMFLVANKTYKFSYWYVTGNSGTGAPTTVTALSAYYGTEKSLTTMTLIGTVQSSPVLNTTYQQYVETFSPGVSGVYYLGIQAVAAAGTAYVTIDDIGLDELVTCTGTPVAGTIASVSPCPGVPFTLRSTGGTSRFNVAGLTFQWKDSSAVNSSWQNAAGATATTSDYTTSITGPTRYRLIVTCTATGQKDSTADLLINLASFYDCYCTPTYATGASNRGITKVELRNLSNSSSIVYPWYTDYAPQQPAVLPIPLLTMTVADTLSVTVSSNATNYTGVWIDFNHNSVFDASEYFSNGGANTAASGVAKIGIVPPATALFGLTRMRIRSGDGAAVTAGMACGATGSAFGEAEDYYVTIQYPPCAGPVNAGAARSSDLSTCVGYSVNLSDTTHEQRMSGTSWSWQSSLDGGLSWTPVANTAGKDTLNNVLVTRAVQYRLRMICDNTGDSTFSVPVAITIKPPYACYCVSQSTGTAADYSDIGAVQIGDMVNNTGGPHILNPEAIRRHTFFTEIPNITMNADGRYRLSIYHTQRNAVHENARVSVFVDYNNDLVYNAAATPNSERVFTGLTSAGNFYIDTVLRVPNAVIPNALTGLRVILNSDLDPNAPANLGCGEYLSGETEDYVVRFNRAPAGIGGVGGNMQGMALYPNPTEGRFTVNVSGTQALGEVSVQVTTITGQSVLRRSYGTQGNKFTAEVDLGDQARGIYFVEVRAGEEKLVRRVVLR